MKATSKVAQVAIQSPLPQLDRLFDYSIPENLESVIQPGVRVRIKFGRSAALMDGFVISISEESEFAGKLSEISEVVSTVSALSNEIYQLARVVADRQASSISDILRLAVPDRSVAIEKKWIEAGNVVSASVNAGESKRVTALIRPAVVDGASQWVRKIATQAQDALAAGESTLIIVPDYRDQAALLKYLKAHQEVSGAINIIDYSTNQTKSKRYAEFLACLTGEPSIVIGSRAAIYAPVRNLKQIIIWDDSDSSHYEPSSPYSHTREIALLRQQIQGNDVFLFGHSRSTEVARLLSIGFLKDATDAFPMPKIANSDSDIRVDSMAWRAIRAGLETGPVLIQVAGRGHSSTVFCADCDERATCKTCHGPLWIDNRNITKCRWCNASNLDFTCGTCGSSKAKQGRPGSSRTVADFGKAFPGVRVIESTGDEPLLEVGSSKGLVISTPGAEPNAARGYSAVIILDAQRALGKDTLRSTEDAIRSWSNAVAKLSIDGQAVLVGVSGTLANKFSLWAMGEIADHELASRVELRYPPAVRMASVGAERKLIEEISPALSALNGVEILGPVSIVEKGQETEVRILLKYEYSQGAELAALLKAQMLKASAGQQRFSAKSGRAMRPIRVKMDDVEVI